MLAVCDHAQSAENRQTGRRGAITGPRFGSFLFDCRVLLDCCHRPSTHTRLHVKKQALPSHGTRPCRPRRIRNERRQHFVEESISLALLVPAIRRQLEAIRLTVTSIARRL